MYLVSNDPLTYPKPQEYGRWQLVERFGWTLPQIDALPLKDLHDLIQIDDARAKAQKMKAKGK